MASPVSAKKRKRKSHLTTPNKRRRTLQSPASTPASEVTDPPTQEQEVFPARRILQESARKYLVDWEDHPITGEKYPPSWEWKKDVGAGLIADWEAHQKKTSQTTTEADEASDDCTEQPPSAPPSRRRPVIPSSSPSAQQTEPEESTSRVPLDTPSPDLGAFVEQTGGPAGSWSYHTSTQEVPSTYVSDSVALGTNSQFNTTEEESGTGEDTQSGAQETGTSQEGSNSYHPEPSASVDQGNSTDNTVNISLTTCLKAY